MLADRHAVVFIRSSFTSPPPLPPPRPVSHCNSAATGTATTTDRLPRAVVFLLLRAATESRAPPLLAQLGTLALARFVAIVNETRLRCRFALASCSFLFFSLLLLVTKNSHGGFRRRRCGDGEPVGLLGLVWPGRKGPGSWITFEEDALDEQGEGEGGGGGSQSDKQTRGTIVARF